ncbi:HNH endonuclease [Nocardioides szechwanensis]|uniref:HNH nuclease domain-containing protein n=1 Tax=Nocardioides szechwanensis TaxID=1005944 RepID=A0A1H0LFW2_9ACTN|nr:DUF222 domain-containing protein [Nocardioides szechwanensis]GEP36154.1 HNH endonuclease [Nocardioides szechwanensis]SDO67108.1 hypothetical protein SAMN05192576_0237 [Nocardioides szechwanensis]
MFEVSGATVSQWVTHLADMSRDLTDTERVDLIRALEDLKNVAAAAQATVAVDLDTSQRAAQEQRGWPAARLGEGVASQVGLARRESATKGARLLGLAKVLHREMPHTLHRMRTGQLSEWRATILARETACLSLDDRREVDRRLCGPGGTGPDLPDHALGNAARKLAADLDNAAVAARARKAEADRHVTLRPAPDTMTWLSALLPVKDGVAVYAALRAAADTARATGDPRSRGQVMADTLVERVTGRSVADPVRVNLDLVMTDRTFFGTSEESAHVPGYRPVPAERAHDLLADALDAVQVWVRRLYTHPGTGQLVGLDSRARHAPAGLADLVRHRDQDLCRTPWCGAPIRTTDHVRESQVGGDTSKPNLQGLCERCNLAKQAPGWRARPSPETLAGTERHTVITTTPTGHTYRSRAPAPLGHLDYNSRTTLDYELIA